MLSNVFSKTLRDMRVALFWWIVGMFLMTLYVVALYPSIQESGSNVQDYFNTMPEAFKAMFGGVPDLSKPEGFLSMELFSFFYPLMVLAWTVTYGAGLIGGEEDNRTLDLLLSTPVARWRVVLEKFVALVVFSLIVFLATYLGVVAGAVIADVQGLDMGDVLIGTLNMAPLGLFFGALALCLTGLKSGRGLALGATLGFVAVSYLVDIMAEVSNIPDWLRRLSPWYYYNGDRVLFDGVNAGHALLLLGLTVVLVGLAMWGFERRDVGV